MPFVAQEREETRKANQESRLANHGAITCERHVDSRVAALAKQDGEVKLLDVYEGVALGARAAKDQQGIIDDGDPLPEAAWWRRLWAYDAKGFEGCVNEKDARRELGGGVAAAKDYNLAT